MPKQIKRITRSRDLGGNITYSPIDDGSLDEVLSSLDLYFSIRENDDEFTNLNEIIIKTLCRLLQENIEIKTKYNLLLEKLNMQHDLSESALEQLYLE